jgi:chromosome segregation ATPase
MVSCPWPLPGKEKAKTLHVHIRSKQKSGLRAAMAAGSAKVEEVQREVAGLKAQASDRPKVNQDLTNLARELATLKEEMRELQLQKAAMADQLQRHEQEICDEKHEVALLRTASDSHRESQERETQAVVDVRRVVGQLAGDVANLPSENDRKRLAIGEVARANEQLRAEAARLKERIEVLNQENQRLSAANEVVKRDIGQVSDCCPEVTKDLTNQEQEVAKLKEEKRATRPKAEPFASPAANVALPPVPASSAPAKPAPKPAPVKVSPPPAPPIPATQFLRR